MARKNSNKYIGSFKAGTSVFSSLKVLPFFWRTTGYLVLSSAMINIFGLALPLVLMQVYDRILPNQALSTLGWLVSGVALSIVLESMLRYLRSTISQRMGAAFEYLVTYSAMERALSSRLEQFEAEGPGAHMDRVNSISILKSFYSGQIFQAILDLPFTALFLYAIWFLAGDLVYVPLALVGLFALISIILKFGFEGARKQQVFLTDRRSNFVFETLGGIHQVKTLSLEEQMLRRYERLASNAATIDSKANNWSDAPINLGVLFSHLTLFGVIGYGAYMVIEGQLTVGSLTACTILAGRALQPALSAAGFWMRFSDANIARAQVRQIMDLNTEDQFEEIFSHEIRGAIGLRDVTFGFKHGEELLLDHLNLKIFPRQMVVVQSGDPRASTALLLGIQGVQRPDSGSIWIDDYNLNRWQHDDMRGLIEYLPDKGTLFRGTILENITMFDPNRREDAKAAATLLKLDDLVAHLPMGYETVVKSQSHNVFSSALILRVTFARVLINRPRILLLDRSGGALDSESELILQDLLQLLKGECTLIVATPQEKIAELADRVIALEDGVLTELSKTGA